MRLLGIATILFFLGTAVPAEEVSVLTLREAARKGMVTAHGERPGSYRSVDLVLRNRTEEDLTVDLCASYLKPRNGSCQRLGLGPAITPEAAVTTVPGTVVVTLGPKEKRVIRLNTCCLDAGRPAPSKEVFDVARGQLEPVREKVLRWWADHPGAPQSAVNSAIWCFRETVRIAPGTARNYTRPRGLFPALHDGTSYLLRDGEATSLDPEGIRRILGAEIFTVLPTDAGVFAVALGEGGAPELWRLVLTGREPWGRVMEIDGEARVREVLPLAGGNLAVVTDQGVSFRRASDGRVTRLFESDRVRDVSARVGRDGNVVVVLRVPGQGGHWQQGEIHGQTADRFAVHVVDARTGKCELVRKFWNVKVTLAGRGGVFGLSHAGHLRKLVGRSMKNFGPQHYYSRLLAVGGKAVWLLDTEGRLTAVSARTGRELLTTDRTLPEDAAFDVDAVTGDLAWVEDGRFVRLRLADGGREEIGAE